MKKMKNQLIDLLNIHATSGHEKPVRDYLKPILENKLDSVFVDSYGNLLGDKVVGSGVGATVMLSAHMDTVKAVLKDRKLIEKDGTIYSDIGALGADDRAGIAIILSVLRNIDNINFNGRIKVAFSREEEVGCKGADKINPKWYSNVDLAIVVDRRGARDIVVGCGSAFCSDSVGNFMEDVSKLADMDWKCVEGGISDAVTFSGEGVNSINLSAGYYNEHTSNEFVVIDSMKDTLRLILQTFAVINQFYKGFEEIGFENKWVKSWNNNYNYQYNYYNDMFSDDEFFDEEYDDSIWSDIWAEEEDDLNGDIFIYELDNDVIIQQNNQIITTDKKVIASLMKQLNSLNR